MEGSNRSARKNDDLPASSCQNTDACVRGNMGELETTPQNAAAIRRVLTAIGRGHGVRSNRRPCDKTRTWPPSTPQRFDPRWNSDNICLQTPNVYPIRYSNAMTLFVFGRGTAAASMPLDSKRVPTHQSSPLPLNYRLTGHIDKTHGVVKSTAKLSFRQHKPCRRGGNFLECSCLMRSMLAKSSGRVLGSTTANSRVTRCRPHSDVLVWSRLPLSRSPSISKNAAHVSRTASRYVRFACT